MSVVDTIETLIKLGALLKDAGQKASAGTSIDWTNFLTSAEFAQIQAAATGLLNMLTESDLDQAISALAAKQDALLGGKTLVDLPTDKLIQYSDLGDARLILAARKVKLAANAGFFGWLVQDALPVLIATAPKIIPLLV